MALARYFIFFLAFSFLGWVYETIYCTIAEKSFQNRGFLFGPVCPIYGVGAIAAQALFVFVDRSLGIPLDVWGVFALCAVGSAIVEYVTSWYLEARFHARWWDYSRMPLNVNGRICLPATLLFGIMGVFIVRIVMPAANTAIAGIDPLVVEGVGLVAGALLGADIALSEASLSGIVSTIENIDSEFTAKGEAAYQLVTDAPQQLASKAQEHTHELRDRVRSAAGSMSATQLIVLKKIKRFAPHRTHRSYDSIGAQLKDAVRELKDRRNG